MTKRLRRLRMGLSTVLGLRRQGFFIPYRYADSLPGPGRRPGYRAVGDLLTEKAETFLDVLRAIDELAGDLEAIGKAPAPAPRWNQGWFPRLDAAAAYAMVRTRRPGRIVEVGSGHSTRFFARAVADAGLPTRITAIDPAPRADIAKLAATVLRSTVHDVDRTVFGDIEPGDFLIIDSSHILMPGSDVDLLLNDVLPALPAGVVVHIHDVFLPDDYPAEWDWRGYNEQQGVAALLQGGAYDVLWSSRYAATRLDDAVAASVAGRLPIVAGAFESSLWLEKKVVA